MFIAPDFVFVHLSKTGGTFAAQCLREVFCRWAILRRIHGLKNRHGIHLPFFPYRYDESEQHGLCNDIPEIAKDRLIISCIRNPFDLYVSEYTFQWWKQYPNLWFHDFPVFAQSHPKWKQFSFEEFIRLSNKHASWVQRTLTKFPKADSLGWYAHKFVYYYCRDHSYVFDAADNFQTFMSRVRETMYPVHFIHTDRLNQELFDFLLAKGYPKSRIQHIIDKEKVNTSRQDHNWRRWYSPELRKEIEERDALLFTLFPEFGF